MRIIRDEEIEQTLRTFSKPVFEQAGLSPKSVQFILIEDSELNAFVAGGQNIFLNTGLILKADRPDELIGVIAHETGHIAGGHLFRTQETYEELSLQAIAANILGVAAAVAAKSGELGMAISAAGEQVATRQMLRHSRVQETSADQAAVRFLKEAGLPVEGLRDFMKKLQSQELLPESEQSAYVRTHPLTRDRVDFLSQIVEKDGNGNMPQSWQERHDRMKAKLEGFLYPEKVLGSRYRPDDNSIAKKYAIAIAHYRKSRSAKALELLAELIDAEPRNAYFHELKGQILMESGDIASAAAAYDRAARLMPSSGLIRAAFGHALIENNHLDKGIGELQASLQTEPRQTKTHRLLAIAYGKRGKEGLSRLHLAEEALLLNKFPLARKEAELALKLLPEKSAARLRARDILDVVDRKDKKSGKKNTK